MRRWMIVAALLLCLPMVAGSQTPGIWYRAPGGGGVTLKAIDGTVTQATGTSEEVIKTYTIPAGLLAKSGDVLRVKLSVLSAANANAKIIRLRLGGLAGTEVFLVSGGNNTKWDIELHIIRTTSAANQGIVSRYNGSAAGTAIPNYAATTVNLAAASDLVLTFSCATAASDLTFNFWSIELLSL